MYEFYYNYGKIRYNVNLLFTGRHSLVFEFKTNDGYKDFYEDKDLFDFSDYPKYSKLFDPTNKKVIA